ncbi:hypothetical protein M2459_000192 [Parabacteroides sp. PF5-5]|uniref:hypothetical protein n=1 Tax=unclassified Parabacteroides TaxID=2649774 RepID=UPI002474909D|nr:MULTISPECIES: hypothetical protein [unclassified Parabacteroides]MDH6303860.1 hypothetical protein [Parabacteroides sp. PH5-39]MDH6314477.1 hypothetical protein [Parabacteroides sp. PF5-13]MDH6318458.1 hypothetical protein [Parabacteroides sp. PH5-13]MDH6322249.1 hypothetical protein [Parabacteroides sp. PH5-8]MDH6325671.1 hypothetical protein [Parabacteroides sp. PH5-41]
MGTTWIMKTISEYWESYNSLVDMIEDEGIKKSLKDAQLYLNGLTDGWYGFLNEFEKVIVTNSNNLTPEQQKLATFLIKDLKYNLEHRY